MGSSQIIAIVCSLLSPIYVFPLLFSFLILIFKWKVALLTTVLLFLIIYHRICLIIIKTLPRDIRYLYRITGLVSLIKKLGKENRSVSEVFQSVAKENFNRTCLLFEDEDWSYRKMEETSNRVANVLADRGMQKGDVVALLMGNSPTYVAVWLGASKLGVITALINQSLKGDSLKHCITSAKSKAVIFSSDYEKEITNCKLDLDFYRWGNSGSEKLLDAVDLSGLVSFAKVSPPLVTDPPKFSDKLLYIFTSGTTGLPKAAVIYHRRFLLAAAAATTLLRLNKNDVVYNPLPLSHSSGGCLGLGPALTSGIPCAIRSRFSASAFFTDCIKYNATIGLYIGEMCRYILSTPVQPNEKNHKIRLLFGNGLRPAIWEKFVARFGIPQIAEFYGATEGNVNMVNLDNKLGAVGCIPVILPSRLNPVVLVRANMETGEAMRNSEGLCVKCEPGEPGLLVGLIKNNDPSRKFDGYVNEEETKKKIIRNVFRHGDAAFNSGDLVVQDELGFVYFKDRTGDTFRWKGENVACSEVELVLGKAGIEECAVYGVEVNELEGRAGAAALVPPPNLSLTELATCLDTALPHFARPIFLRLLPALTLTMTFKTKKPVLQKLGIDPSISPADHTLLIRQGPTFVPLTAELYADIVAEKVKL